MNRPGEFATLLRAHQLISMQNIGLGTICHMHNNPVRACSVCLGVGFLATETMFFGMPVTAIGPCHGCGGDGMQFYLSLS